MDKNEVLKILETAKDENGEVPMRLVRQAFDKLPEPIRCKDCYWHNTCRYEQYLGLEGYCSKAEEKNNGKTT